MGRDYKHLSLEERVYIETQLSLGLVPSAIARGLGRAATTVLRELRRNGWQPDRPRVRGGYHSLPADRRARRLAARPRVEARMKPGTALWERVIGYLRQGLSPAQIARTLARMPDPVRLSYETIYNSLYAMPRGHLRSSLLKLTRRHHHARRPQRGNKGPQKPPIPEMVLIDQRPREAAQRLIPGHWEGDLIIGKGNRSQVGVLVDRKTLFLALVQLDSHARRPRGSSLCPDPEPLRQPTAPLAHLRPGLGDASLSPITGNHWHPGLLRSSALALGARHLRKHQRIAPPVPAQRH